MIIESKMDFLFFTGNGVMLVPGPNDVPDEKAKAMLALQDTKERIAAGLLSVEGSVKTDKPVSGKVGRASKAAAAKEAKIAEEKAASEKIAEEKAASEKVADEPAEDEIPEADVSEGDEPIDESPKTE